MRGNHGNDHRDFKLAGKVDLAASIIGRSVIVHEKADDFTSQPTGDAGGRLARGVIRKK